MERVWFGSKPLQIGGRIPIWVAETMGIRFDVLTETCQALILVSFLLARLRSPGETTLPVDLHFCTGLCSTVGLGSELNFPPVGFYH